MENLKNDFIKCLEYIKIKNPVIHHMTNYVTANDCANVCVSIGASPVMAQYYYDAYDILKFSNALVINIGTLDEELKNSMISVGSKANKKNIPIVLDPVGAGASKIRYQAVKSIIKFLKPSVIKGNFAEIKTILGDTIKDNKCIDSIYSFDCFNDDEKKVIKDLATKLNTVIAITGKNDYITDGKRDIIIQRGTPLLAGITGTGCMSATLIGSFLGCEEDHFKACVYGILTMNISGEIAKKNMLENEGSGMFKVRLIDAISNIHNIDFDIEEGIYYND